MSKEEMKLEPCPFCGEKPVLTKHFKHEMYSFMHRCSVLGPISRDFRELAQDHVDMWNTRAAPASPQAAQPVAYQFQDRDGKWFGFMNERHYQDTVADGTWPIRELFTHADAGEVERLRAQLAERDALLYKWSIHLGNMRNLSECFSETEALLSTTAKPEADHGQG
ncbi:Lar family restriction alleviation protein [Pseudomonas sp. D47]|uniref:Lar family restriction alleviation protein n=1 Tax=Pseudomonas sp. D47 TaxID=3159447 RepID=UPI00387B3911